MKYREVTHAVEEKLPGDGIRSGRERNVWVSLDGRRRFRVTLPKVHGRADVPPGTLISIRKQLRLDWSQFTAFVACPMSRADYERYLRGLVTQGRL